MHIDTFRMDKEIIDRAFSFAEDLWSKKAQSPRDFGSTSGRKIADFIADTVEGKLAEEAFRLFLNTNFKIKIRVDYDIYPGMYEIDYGNDLQQVWINGELKFIEVKVDLKSARGYSQWLLLEEHKFWADIYVLATLEGLNSNWEYNPYQSRNNRITVSIAGFAYFTDIIDNLTKKPWFTFNAGRNLVTPKSIYPIIKDLQSKDLLTPPAIMEAIRIGRQDGKVNMMNVDLKAPVNYGLPKRWLRKGKDEWVRVIRMLAASSIHYDDQIIYKS